MILIGEHSENIVLMNINNKIKWKKYFASASNDTDIRICDYFQGVCINVLSGHKLKILCLVKLNKYKIYSAGRDKVIKIWNRKKIIRSEFNRK